MIRQKLYKNGIIWFFRILVNVINRLILSLPEGTLVNLQALARIMPTQNQNILNSPSYIRPACRQAGIIFSLVYLAL